MVTRSNVEKSVARRNRAGFTLMEVLVVVAILVILAGVGSVAVFGYLEESKAKTARIQIKTLEDAVSNYKLNHGDFPASLEILTRSEDGRPATLEANQVMDPWGREYGYEPANLSATGKPLIYSQGGNPGNPSSRISNH